MSSGDVMKHLMGTPWRRRSGWHRCWSLCIVGQRIPLCVRRALMLDAFIVLHWWLVDDRKEKNPKIK
jgi:hypothetical protein